MSASKDTPWQIARADGSETAIIGGLLADPTILNDVLAAGLEHEHFYEHERRMLFIAVLNLSDRQEGIDAPSVGAEAARHSEAIGRYTEAYLTEIADSLLRDSPAMADPGAHASAIIAAHTDRRIQAVAQRLLREVGNPAANKREVLNRALDDFGAIRIENTSRGPDGLAELMAARTEAIIAGRGAPKSTVRTGFESFDRLTGGFRRQGLIIVAAPAGLGKSSLTLQWAITIGYQTRQCVPVFSLEMGPDDIVNRALSQFTGIDTMTMHEGNIGVGLHDRLRDASAGAQGANVRIDHSRARTIPQIRAACKVYAAKHGQLGAILVDFLQLVSSGAKTDGRVDEVSMVSTELKALAGDMNCPVIAISNLNRLGQKDNERPTRASLKWSSQIESDADIIMFLYREKPAMPDGRDEIEWIVDKNRHGGVGTLLATFERPATRYEMDLRTKPPPEPRPPPRPRYGRGSY